MPSGTTGRFVPKQLQTSLSPDPIQTPSVFRAFVCGSHQSGTFSLTPGQKEGRVLKGQQPPRCPLTSVTRRSPIK